MSKNNNEKKFESINPIVVQNDKLVIYASKDLENFAKESIEYLTKRQKEILLFFNLVNIDKIMIDIHSDRNLFEEMSKYNFTDFAGFFNEQGVLAFLNLNGNYSNEKLQKKLVHEMVHHIYKYYVYKNQERITWIDEGLATYLSNDREIDETSLCYLQEQLLSLRKLPNINKLTHGSNFITEQYNGYFLSYLAVKYMNETITHEKFIEIIKDHDTIINIGNNILPLMIDYYKETNKKNIIH